MGIEQFLLERATKKGIDLGIEKGIEKGIDLGIEKGIEKGIDLGVQKNKIETVIAAREDGMEIPRIARIAKISEDKVMQILKEHNIA